MKSASYLKVDGKLLKVSNLDKVLYPAPGFRKRDVIRYYKNIAPAALPHLRDRPFTLNRFPNGVDQASFYEKNCPFYRPKWVQLGELRSNLHCLVNDLPTLIWVASLAAIELHTTLGTIDDLETPTMIAFDLDPGEGVGMRECAQVGLLLREMFEESGLKSFPKTSGKKGLHVFVPLNTPATYDETKGFARRAAESLQRRHPDFVTPRMAKKLRAGKIFIDWSQNVDFKTTTTVYSLRANERPTVSTPLKWREVELAARKDSEARKLLSFEADDVVKRVESLGDLYEPVLKLKQKLPRLRLGVGRPKAA